MANYDLTGKGDRHLATDMELYKIYRSYVQHEDTLINNRATWMFTIHGFLFATYGLTVQKRLEIVSKLTIDQSGLVQVPHHISWALIETESFIVFINLVGLAISFACFYSLKAARLASNGVVKCFKLQFLELKSKSDDNYVPKYPGHDFFILGPSARIFLPSIVGGGVQEVHNLGERAPRAMPVIFISGWIASLGFIFVDVILNYKLLYGAYFK